MAVEQFVGRPDGLGNRMEEIYFLMARNFQNGTTCEYLWNNVWSHRVDRRYPILFNAPSVKITEMIFPPQDKISHSTLDKHFTQQQVFSSARQIRPLFPVPVAELQKVTGVHIRRGDKIKHNPPAHEMTEQQSMMAQECALHYVNHNCDAVYVCGDDPLAVTQFKNNVRSGVDVLTFPNTTTPEYFDYFCLARCKEVVMASRYSSFAITASVLGNSAVHTFFDPDVYENDTHRFKANVISHGMIK